MCEQDICVEFQRVPLYCCFLGTHSWLKQSGHTHSANVMGGNMAPCVMPWSGRVWLLSGVPDYFGRNKISSGGDLSHYSSASLY